jgi:hypothetical protein
MNDLLAHLLHLAMAWTGYVGPEALPEVEVVVAAQMPCDCMGVFLYTRRFHGYGTSVQYPARLLLRKDVDLDSAYGRSILLHELVHALQAKDGPAEFASPLWYRREREAYRVQWRFLRASGLAMHRSLNLPRLDE